MKITTLLPALCAGVAGLALAGCAAESDSLSAEPDAGETSDGGGASDSGAASDAANGPDSAGEADADGGEEVVTQDPGRVTIHRLNRSEYNNTVRDLFGTEQTPADDFPVDDTGYGFDNIADVLSVSPLHVEMYAIAAESLVEEALEVPMVPESTFKRDAEFGTGTVGSAGGTAWNLWSNGSVTVNFNVPTSGEYELRVDAWQTAAGDEAAEMEIRVADTLVGTFAVDGSDTVPSRYRMPVTLEEGALEISATFTNDYYDPDAGADRNLLVDSFEIHGPLDLPTGELNPLRERLFGCTPAQDDPRPCYEETLASFVARAWRRPATDAELTRLLEFFDMAEALGDPIDVGLSYAMQAALVSPNFVYRVELDVDPVSMDPELLDDYEFASRLSYFLWSSMPDQELFDAAAEGRLNQPEEIERHVRRMLQDERARALVDNFAGQWLYIRAIDGAMPDPWVFPEWDGGLKVSMREEMELFFETFIFENRSMLELVLADDTFIDPTLAEHYGIDEYEGTGFERVYFDGVPRGGILGQAGLLTALSYPTRTSPVRRGKWVLGELLCMEPDPPPAGVEGLPEGEDVEGLSLRERMAQHSTDPTCASCHVMMDSIGFALENYDGIGQWREAYADGAIDAHGDFPDGREFEGPEELAQIIAEDPAYTFCVTTKLYTYALGRGTQVYDGPHIRGIHDDFAEADFRFVDLAIAIAQSDSFRYRRGEPTPPETDSTEEE